MHPIRVADLAPEPGTAPDDASPLGWVSPRREPFHLAGFPWLARDGVYRRLPLHPAEPLPPDVEHLANNTAGGQLRFGTDSPVVAVRVRLDEPATPSNMPATTQGSFDAYLGTGTAARYAGTAKYDFTRAAYEAVLFRAPPAGQRIVTLNFPLYRSVRSVDVGLAPDAAVTPAPPYESARRIVVYGTSITQGGCASRPGMAYSNILSRRIPLEFLNVGLNGSGKGEPAVARAISSIADVAPVAAFVLDYDTNVPGADRLRATLAGFVRVLRERHPAVPILVLSRPCFAADGYDPARRADRLLRRDAQAGVVAALAAAGDANLVFVDGGELFGADFGERTVDGVHPTDLGFARMADRLEPLIRHLIGC